MLRTGEKSHLCQNDETFVCSIPYRSVENLSELYGSIENTECTNLYGAEK